MVDAAPVVLEAAHRFLQRRGADLGGDHTASGHGDHTDDESGDQQIDQGEAPGPCRGAEAILAEPVGAWFMSWVQMVPP